MLIPVWLIVDPYVKNRFSSHKMTVNGYDESRDSLEWFAPGGLDYSGWEFCKTLRLFCKCNLSLNEHLQSSIIYECDDNIADRHFTKLRKRT